MPDTDRCGVAAPRSSARRVTPIRVAISDRSAFASMPVSNDSRARISSGRLKPDSPNRMNSSAALENFFTVVVPMLFQLRIEGM